MKYAISLGSNTPDAHTRVSKAIGDITTRFHVMAVSDIYTTDAIDGKSPSYHNAVMSIESTLRVGALQSLLKELEREAGRCDADKARGVVPLDLDLVVCDDEVLRPVDFGRSYFSIGFSQVVERLRKK